MSNTLKRLPHFIIIGAMKSGTTSLYRYLAEHPDIEMSREKETDFFVAEKNWELGMDWYSSQFSSDKKVRGEASPNYTKQRDFPGVAERMHALCPDLKLIYIVRDPVLRAVSQFKHSFIQGTLNPEIQTFYGSHEYEHIMDASKYASQMDAYLAVYPKESILVLDFDDLATTPQKCMDQITDHIGIARHAIFRKGKQNDSVELSRIPAPILRFAQTRSGQRMAAMVPRNARDKVRGLLARGKERRAPEFPADLLATMKSELSAETARFRAMTGHQFANWSV
jgi:hypothetical protein